MHKCGVKELKELLRPIVAPGEQIITPWIWGAGGIGKSDSILQLRDEFQAVNDKEIQFLDLRCSLIESVDFTGLPKFNMEKTSWAQPEFLPEEGTYGFMFLDEVNRAKDDVLQTVYQLALSRKIGWKYKFPKTWSLIMAGNEGDKDKSNVRELDAPLYTRFAHFVLEPEYSEWKEYMQGRSYKDLSTVAFCDTNRKFWLGEIQLGPYPCPRTWEMLTKIINLIGGNTKENYNKIFAYAASLVGSSAAVALRTWSEDRQVIEPELVLEDISKYKAILLELKKSKRDMLYQIAESVIELAGKKKEIKDKYVDSLLVLFVEILDEDHAVNLGKKLAKTNKVLLIKLNKHDSFMQKLASVLG